MGCDHDQKAALFTLFKGYRTQVMEIASSEEKQIRESRQDESLDRKHQAIAKYDAVYRTLDETDRLSAEFFRDLRSLLNETQAAAIPALERHHRRHSGNRLCVSGPERLDLVEIVETINAARTPELVDALTDYESRFDHLLVEKGRRIRRLFERIADSEINQDHLDEATLGEVLRLLTKGSLEIRDFQLSRVRSIGLLLTDEERSRWEVAVRERAWPRVYAFDLTGEAFRAVIAVDALSPEQKAMIIARHERYLEAAIKQGPAYVKAIDQWQAEMARADVTKVLDAAREDSEENPLHAATQAREQSARNCVTEMLAVLTTEQRKSLKHEPLAESPRVNEDLLPIGDGHEEYMREWRQQDEEES